MINKSLLVFLIVFFLILKAAFSCVFVSYLFLNSDYSFYLRGKNNE